MPWFPLKLLGFGSWLKRLAGAALDLAARRPWQTAALVLALLALWNCQGKRDAQADARAARAETKVQRDGWVKEIKLRRADHAAFAAAAKESERLHREQIQQTEAKFREIARAAQSQHRLDLADALRRSRAYADAHRVRGAGSIAPAAFGGPGAAPAPGQDRAPPGDHRAGGEAELVAITRRDLDICTVNTVRLETIVNGLAPEWVRAGLALPDPAFGAER